MSAPVVLALPGTHWHPRSLVQLFSIAEMTVFLGYAHWHLLPAVEQPALQWLGLTLYLLGGLWLFWVDSYLTQQFSGA